MATNSRKHRTKARIKKQNSRSHSKTRAGTTRTAGQYSERFVDRSSRVLDAISKMRDNKLSLNKASKEAGISPSTVKRWAGSALQKRSNGKWVAKKSDSLLRILTIPAPGGKREIAVRGSRKASQLAYYWNVVDRYLSTGDASGLAKFSGKYITAADGERISFITDRAVLNRGGSAGVFSFESLYVRSA
jgi:hypothetical protein